MNPVTLGRLRLKNPLVLAPMTTYASHSDGTISDDELPYLRRRGGFGAIITAACCVHPSGYSFEGQWHCFDDRFIPSLCQAATAIREGGSQPILQIHHGGRMAPSRLCGQPVSASAIPAAREGAEVPRALTIVEIEELIGAFADAARRAVEAGYVGVEIHGANTYLLQQFVSPHSNRRADVYGMDPFLFSERIARAVRAAVPNDFAVGYRFSPEENEEPGIDLDRTAQLLARLSDCDLDFLHVSLRDYRQVSAREPARGNLIQFLCSCSNLPLIGVGSIQSDTDVNACLALGCQAVAVGRAALSDPDFAEKVLRNEPPILKLPRGDFATTCVLPAGLAAKIEAVPGWIPREED